MFRHNHTIRLTSIDVVLFARVTGADRPPPTTVDDYNLRLEAAARNWGGHTDAERLLARMARDMMLDPLDPTDVLSKRQIGAPRMG